MSRQPSRIGFIGIGLLGRGLALALSARGYPVTGAASRSFSSAQWLSERVDGCRAYGTPQALADDSDLVFITTPDSVIGEVASRIVWRNGQGVVHCSGASSTELLRPAALQGSGRRFPASISDLRRLDQARRGRGPLARDRLRCRR